MRAHSDISFSGIGFSFPVALAFIRVFRGLTRIEVRFGEPPKVRALHGESSTGLAPSRRGDCSPDFITLDSVAVIPG
jgi:hypothetical protein